MPIWMKASTRPFGPLLRIRRSSRECQGRSVTARSLTVGSHERLPAAPAVGQETSGREHDLELQPTSPSSGDLGPVAGALDAAALEAPVLGPGDSYGRLAGLRDVERRVVYAQPGDCKAASARERVRSGERVHAPVVERRDRPQVGEPALDQLALAR